MSTKSERREKKRRKARHGMKVDGAGNRLLQRIILQRAAKK